MLVGAIWRVMRNVVMVSFSLLVLLLFVSANSRSTKIEAAPGISEAQPLSYHVKTKLFSLNSGYQHVWPELEFGWRIIVGTLIGIFGAACGSVGGVGGGGIFVPMLILVIGFDPKSTTAISKCMVTGAAISTLFFNLKQKHPTYDDIPIIDYDLLLLFQPLRMLGISIGVVLSIVFADWMLTVLLIMIFIGTSVKAFFRGVETWKKETIMKMEAVKLLESTASSSGEDEYKCLPDYPDGGPQKDTGKPEGTILRNIRWKEFGLLSFVWFAILLLQIALTHTASCSITYWILMLLQIPVSVGVSLYQAVGLYQRWRITPSEQDHGSTHLKLHLLILSGFSAPLAGIFGGLLGVGSGFVMGPLFLELGIIPQVASATATFGMTFTASISVVQYYLLNRFPVPYALYLTLVATVAVYIGQKIIDKLINIFQRASLIIFVLSFTIFISTIALGGVGISDIIEKIQRDEYMGFEDLCKYDA